MGKGFGKVVLYRFLDFAFNEMALDYLTTLVLPSNETALKLYNKFGFKEKKLSIMSEDDISVMEMSKKNWVVKKEELEHVIGSKHRT